MSERRAITLSYLNEIFSLNAEIGELTWRSRPRGHFKNSQSHSAWNTRYSGKIAGNRRDDGYILVRIDGSRFLLHRIVYAMSKCLDLADVPEVIDHKDNDCTNNSALNLREAEYAQNSANSGAHSDNTSGYKGVSWEKRYKHWEARIRANGKRYHLGYFKNPEDAHAAYIKAANDLHGEFARAA
jgi:hypothetical protein